MLLQDNCTVPGLLKGPALQARIDSKLEGSMLHCSYGPEDFRAKEPKAVPAEKGTRIKRTDLGRSVKRGCKARFATKIQPGIEDIVEILYYHTDHTGHVRCLRCEQRSFCHLSINRNFQGMSLQSCIIDRSNSTVIFLLGDIPTPCLAILGAGAGPALLLSSHL